MSIQTDNVPRKAPGWMATIVVVALCATAVLLFQHGLTYGAGDNQLVRFGVWAIFVFVTLAALVFFGATLAHYDVNLLRLPSTYLSLASVFLAVVLVLLRREIEPTFFFTELSHFEMALLATVAAFFLSALAVNILKTNMVFGCLLTLVQVTFSVIVLVVAVYEPMFSDRRNSRNSR